MGLGGILKQNEGFKGGLEGFRHFSLGGNHRSALSCEIYEGHKSITKTGTQIV